MHQKTESRNCSSLELYFHGRLDYCNPRKNLIAPANLSRIIYVPFVRIGWDAIQ